MAVDVRFFAGRLAVARAVVERAAVERAEVARVVADRAPAVDRDVAERLLAGVRFVADFRDVERRVVVVIGISPLLGT